MKYLPIILIYFSCAATALGAVMDKSVVNMRVTCDNGGCIYDGQAMMFSISLSNGSGHAIQIPFEYIKKTGPVIEIFDANGNSTQTKRNLADPALKSVLTEIQAGKKVSLEWILYPTEIESLGSAFKEISVNFSILSDIYRGGKSDGRIEIKDCVKILHK